MKEGRAQTALQLAKKAVRKNPFDPNALLHLAFSHADVGDLVAALDCHQVCHRRCEVYLSDPHVAALQAENAYWAARAELNQLQGAGSDMAADLHRNSALHWIQTAAMIDPSYLPKAIREPEFGRIYPDLQILMARELGFEKVVDWLSP